VNRVTQALKGAWVMLAGLIVAISFISWLYYYFQLSFLEMLTLLMVLGIGIVIYLFVVAGGHLGIIEKKIDNGFTNLRDQLTSCLTQESPKHSHLGNPNYGEQKESQEAERKPTGGGALAGMIIGGAIGAAAGGPLGVLIGGVIGALLGNQAEYENLRKGK